jgi:hypothetical protein
VHLVRITALVCAVLVAAWFVVGARQAHDVASAEKIISGPAPVSAADAAHARSLLSSAAFLNPDAQVDILRGRLALARHDNAGALRILERVVHREPLNLAAWVATAQAALNFDRTRLLIATRNIGLLDKSVR